MAAGHVNDSNFHAEVVESEIPVLVDYWAPWCAPCRMVGPTIDKIADEYKGKFKIVKMNVDENQVTAQKHGIASIPTMMIFKNGENVGTIVGAHPEASIKAELAKHM